MINQVPKVTAIMPTFGRYLGAHENNLWVIEEAIQSFIRQTYPNKELVVLNDTPGQSFTLRHKRPNIRVINCASRYKTLGDKRNAAIQLGDGEIIAVWDDDDIQLPGRLAKDVATLLETKAAYVGPEYAWYSLNNKRYRPIHRKRSGLYAAAAFLRTAWEQVPYRCTSVSEDSGLLRDLNAAGHASAVHTQDIREATTIYRRGHGVRHISVQGGSPDRYEKFGDRVFPVLRYKLRPHWRHDYVTSVQSELDKLDV